VVGVFGEDGERRVCELESKKRLKFVGLASSGKALHLVLG